MPQIAYFQPFSGASGDMILGALVDAGLSEQTLEQELRKLGVDGWSLRTEKVLRGAFQTTRLKVLTANEDLATQHLPHSHDHGHDHGHGHSHGHAHGDSHAHHASRPAPVRGLREIIAIIRSSGLPEPVTANAERVFRRLGEAEARAHGVALEDVHFHEVGAVDSIVDIVGVCLGLHLLGITQVLSAPITVGTGFVRVAHGTVPLPAPATLELLRGFPAVHRDSGFELTTPTGAALLTTLSSSFGVFPPMRILAVGYGAGDDRPGPIPNALRVILGDKETRPQERDQVVVLETNIDDMSAEWLGHLQDQLLQAGALDVSVAPILMKKSRPAHAVQVIVERSTEEAIINIIFRESTTFGLRRSETDRVILAREVQSVDTTWGPVRIKVGKRNGNEVTACPEYEDLRRVARESGLALKEIHAQVMVKWREKS